MSGQEIITAPEKFGKITRKNLDVVRRDYGDGGPESLLQFHNELHTLEVMQAVKILIQTWNTQLPEAPVTAREEELLEIAASGHDRVQDAKKRLSKAMHGDNERLSAADVAYDMRRSALYNEEEIRFVSACILATIPEFAPGKLSQPMTETNQMLERGEITDRQFRLTQLLADADLSNLGKGFENTLEWANRLFRELKKRPDEYRNFIRNEISVLENHAWASKVAAIAFPYKRDTIEKFTKMLEEQDRH